eukprot:TRINITY_DN7864_c0_g1_i1.p2 TRINITY_DN7864_c0_g1~~TRINITY_DN7864_c0_g1_i1.p2  ORF type:complete len:153 (+),score=45.11 TRINITY_DN7864_c0_g1_i1:3-461(+)
MGMDALEWAKTGEALGAGEICLNSIDADGTKDGYDLELTRLVAESVTIPVIASGGAGTPQHMVDAVTEGRATAALIASIVHYGEYTIRDLKTYMADAGVQMRTVWQHRRYRPAKSHRPKERDGGFFSSQKKAIRPGRFRSCHRSCRPGGKPR